MEQHPITLALINENTELFPYADRVDIAEGDYSPFLRASLWLNLALRYCWHYTAQWGGQVTTELLLQVAAELHAYYSRHVAEGS